MYMESLQKRIDSIKNEWEKFLEGKLPNPVVVPEKIKKSWERSRAYGLDPFGTTESNSVSDGGLQKHTAHRNASVRKYVRKLIDKYGYVIQLFDSSGNPVTEPTEARPALEQYIGTNSVWFALSENRPSSVLGSEHYHSSLQDYYSAAVPIHDFSRKTIGAILFFCKDMQYVPYAMPLVTYIGRVIEAVNTLQRDRQPETVLEAIFQCLPQGIACFAEGKIQFHNEKILDMLQIRNTKNALEVLEKKLSPLAAGTLLNRKRISMYIEGRQNDLIVTTREKQPPESGEGYRVLLVEEVQNGIRSKQGGRGETLLTFNDIVGKSDKILAAKELSQKVADSDAPVLLYGESGTGKELFAQAIHHASPRKNGPFVAINCGAISADIVESELFGYEPGAFTGALKNGKKGLLEYASGGTVFLDEIETMPLYMQVKLLRAISTGTIVKVGGVKEIPVDLRIISAAKKDLLVEADKNSFREDLYYRISTFIIELPPLRERSNDIKVLAEHFIKKYQKNYRRVPLSARDDFFEALTHYHWRGNVRELENVLERAVFLAEGKELTVDDLPESIQRAYRDRRLKEIIQENLKFRDHPTGMLQVGEEIIIESVLKQTRFNIKNASKILGISSKTLYNKINGNPNLSCLKPFQKIN